MYAGLYTGSYKVSYDNDSQHTSRRGRTNIIEENNIAAAGPAQLPDHDPLENLEQKVKQSSDTISLQSNCINIH